MYTIVVVIYNRKVCKMAIFSGVLKICKYQLTVTVAELPAASHRFTANESLAAHYTGFLTL